ncbi:MAG: hypothetical protein RLZZ500_1534 [Bacteroidota bacterium]|jgi:HPt (histidine-containing phosphotransfer) domain-containing protein
MIKETPNLEYLEQLAAGDQKVRQTIFDVMVKEYCADYQEYKAATVQNDMKKSIIFVHRLKHKIGFLGMEYSYQIAHRYEEELRRNSNRFAPEFEAVLEQIQEFINSTPSL